MSDETILEEAQRLVHSDRGADYGHPIEDFTRSGRMWGAILGIPDVPPEKVAMCMIASKISREVNRNKRDNRVDMAGYAETLDMVREWQAESQMVENELLACKRENVQGHRFGPPRTHIGEGRDCV